MTPRERYLNAYRGRPVDRVPIVLEGYTDYDQQQRLATGDDRARRKIFERLAPHVPYTVPVPTYENRLLITPGQRIREVERSERNGTLRIVNEIDTPRGKLTHVIERNTLTQTTWTEKYPVETIDDIEAIRSVPWELPEGLAAPDMDKLPGDFREKGILRTGVSSPFVCVAGMMPYQMFLELCVVEPTLIEELTRQCLGRTMDLLDVVLEGDHVDYCWMGGCEWVTPPMASDAVYNILVQGPEATVIERLHRSDVIAHVHCHGNVASTIDKVVERGADFFEPVEPPPDGDITMEQARARVGQRLTLGGNIEARILDAGTEDEVEQAVRKAFAGGKQRFVLQDTAGPLGPLSEKLERNYHRLIDVWEELSPVE